jgi:hypothetical protein
MPAGLAGIAWIAHGCAMLPERGTSSNAGKGIQHGGAPVVRFGWFQAEMKRLSGTESRPECAITYFLDSIPLEPKGKCRTHLRPASAVSIDRKTRPASLRSLPHITCSLNVLTKHNAFSDLRRPDAFLIWRVEQ